MQDFEIKELIKEFTYYNNNALDAWKLELLLNNIDTIKLEDLEKLCKKN